MFIGHFGVGFGAKPLAPRTSLGTLLLAAQFVDLLWPTLLLVGLERVQIAEGITKVTPLDFTHYPISHSLVAAVLWGLLFGAVYYVAARYQRGAIVCGIAALSHWILDLVTHRPDLPLVPGNPVRVGMGLWNSLPATLALELLVFTAGVVLYAGATRPLNRRGVYSFWGLVGFLLAVHAANLFGSAPPNWQAIAWTGQAQWLIVIWGYWVDRHREPRH